MVYVWDRFVRIAHWTMVAAFAIAFLTRDSEWYRNIHALAGYVIGGVLLARIIWGMISREYAAFRSFPFQPLAGLRYARAVLTGHAPRYLGHNPAGSLIIYCMMMIGLISVGSGLWVYNEGWISDLSLPLQEIHHDTSWIWMGLITLHVLGVLFESVAHRENLVRSMITGCKKKFEAS